MTSGSGAQRREPPRPPHPSDPYIDWGPALPSGYGHPAFQALVVDPRKIFTYWEFPGASGGGDFALRLSRVGGASLLVRVPEGGGGSWYLEADPGAEYDVELGRLDRGAFVGVLPGRRVRTPRAAPATDVDPEWAPTAEERKLLQGLEGPEGAADFPRAGYVRPGPSHA